MNLMLHLTIACLVALLVAGCASPESGAPRPPAPSAGDAESGRAGPASVAAAVPESPLVGAARAPGTDPPRGTGPRGEIVRVAGRVVTTADLGDHVLRWHPEVASAALDRIVRNVVIQAEAGREGIVLPSGAADAASERALADRLRELRLRFGAATDPAELVRRTTGRTIDDLRSDLRQAVVTELLAERLARLDALRRDGVDLRVLVVPDERPAAALAAQWRAGADAGLLASRMGLEPPSAPGPMALDAVPDADLRARFTAAADGDVLAPVPFEAPEPGVPGSRRTWWQVFRVVRRWAGTSAPWAEAGPRVEAWLREAPATSDEVEAWERRARERADPRPWNGSAPRRGGPPGGPTSSVQTSAAATWRGTSPPDATMGAR